MDPERVVLGSHLTWVCALFIILVLVGLTQTLVRGQCSRRSIVGRVDERDYIIRI